VIQITDHLAEIRHRVTHALVEAGRAGDNVMLVAVSKQQPASSVRRAFEAGQKHFGESYIQEAVAKLESLADLDISWHFLGRIQANKTRTVASRFDWVHSVDRVRVLKRLNDQRPESMPALNVLIQVNQADEGQKSGVAVSDVEALARFAVTQPRLRLRGLMSIPPAASKPRERAEFFSALHRLGSSLTSKGVPVDTLSMGMSGDFEIAIAQGSNCLRIGTAIFGPRLAPPENS